MANSPAPSILLSAFEPFGGSGINGSQQAAHRLAAWDERIELVTVPVVRWEAPRIISERLRSRAAPRLYLALGEADQTPVVRLEKVARNCDDYRIPDNAGNCPQSEPIHSTGPDCHYASIDVEHIARTLEGKTPIPVKVSLSAGTFLCNHLAYTVSDLLAADPICPFCFIHVPAWRPEHGPAALQNIATTLRAILRLAVFPHIPSASN